MSSTLGVLSAVCHTDSMEIFAYRSTISVQEQSGISATEAQRAADEDVLTNWLALHFVGEFN